MAVLLRSRFPVTPSWFFEHQKYEDEIDRHCPFVLNPFGHLVDYICGGDMRHLQFYLSYAVFVMNLEMQA